MEVSFKIDRYNPELDKYPYYEENAVGVENVG
ncbi:succinate dehydrogenase iron-sulfur subunit, partial [Francisella tularensis subsp. holarctica]|nr:succinate dehydrogenase iron-sulfur subunit [Francisella tularensis subsp. holarctica]